MARAPIQTIVIPYRKKFNCEFEFAVFHRTDNSMWHFISGGAEDKETAFEAAKREAKEEAGIAEGCRWIKLEARASIPRTAFSPTSHWPKNILVVPEFSFAVDVTEHEIKLSEEHNEMRWLSFIQATKLLKWDSNKVALWELNERLKNNLSGLQES